MKTLLLNSTFGVRRSAFDVSPVGSKQTSNVERRTLNVERGREPA